MVKSAPYALPTQTLTAGLPHRRWEKPPLEKPRDPREKTNKCLPLKLPGKTVSWPPDQDHSRPQTHPCTSNQKHPRRIQYFKKDSNSTLKKEGKKELIEKRGNCRKQNNSNKF